jgi:hypothetical protein
MEHLLEEILFSCPANFYRLWSLLSHSTFPGNYFFNKFYPRKKNLIGLSNIFGAKIFLAGFFHGPVLFKDQCDQKIEYFLEKWPKEPKYVHQSLI